MNIQFPIKTLDQYSAYAFFEKSFSSDECEKIKALFFDMTSGMVDDCEQKEKTRKSKVKFISADESSSWIFQKFYEISVPCNDVRWRFQLSGFNEGIQLTEYDGSGSHYDWHMDNGNGYFSMRKLSIVLLLSEPDEYDGGELEFVGSEGKKKYSKGTVLIFPSFVGHKVHPVTKGNRKTAVAWISGEPYR